MIHHSDEEIEEEWRTTVLHLHLHRAATLEGVAAANDEGKVVSAKFGVAGRCVGVGETSRRQDGAALDTRLQTLLLESEALEFWKVVTMCRALAHGISYMVREGTVLRQHT